MNKIGNIFFGLLIPLSLSGQLMPVTNQYVLNQLIINPACAGNRGALNISAFYRRQWVGFDKAPETMIFTMDIPLIDSKIGLGFIVTNDKLGVTKETQYISNYAFKINMREGYLSLGLGAGLITTNTAWSDLTVMDPGDEYYLADSHAYILPAISFGLFYTYKNYYAGISVPKLLGYQFNFNKNKYDLMFDPDQYYYLLNTGYVFNLSPKLRFSPSTLITYSVGDKVLYDINAHLNLSERFWIGASYRNNRSVGALLQLALNNQMRVAYTYDFDIGRLGRYSYGSHEIMLRYEFRYKINVVNPLIF